MKIEIIKNYGEYICIDLKIVLTYNISKFIQNLNYAKFYNEHMFMLDGDKNYYDLLKKCLDRTKDYKSSYVDLIINEVDIPRFEKDFENFIKNQSKK